MRRLSEAQDGVSHGVSHVSTPLLRLYANPSAVLCTMLYFFLKNIC